MKNVLKSRTEKQRLHIEKLNKSKIGVKRPDITGEQHPMFGKHHTFESKEKISKGNTKDLSKICKNCGNIFRVYSKKQVYCSNKCSGKANPSMKGKKHSEKSRLLISKNGKGLKRSIETRKRMSLSKSGVNNPFWKGGVTPINRRIRQSLEYRLWKKAVLERDTKCVWCGSVKNLEIDHIKPFSIFPELRFAIDNGRVLCNCCHKTTDTYLHKIHSYKK
jgi:hypothetical protein